MAEYNLNLRVELNRNHTDRHLKADIYWSGIVQVTNRKFVLISFSCLRTEAGCTWGFDIISWDLRCAHGTTDRRAFNAEQMFISCWNWMNSCCMVTGFTGALALIQAPWPFTRFPVTKKKKKIKSKIQVNGHGPNLTPGSAAVWVGGTRRSQMWPFGAECSRSRLQFHPEKAKKKKKKWN